ncbi:hypothetical protein IF650_00765 [Cellulosimicrobium terreum]|nr:hypothetical protein [Cellulosimicrobium terreum]
MSDARLLFVLHHRRGPAVPEGTEVVDHPQIAEHYAFLGRRADDGTLVAAGPMAGSSGEGMTVLSVPTIEDAERLATVDDESVVARVLDVTVTPWRVVMGPGLAV